VAGNSLICACDSRRPHDLRHPGADCENPEHQTKSYRIESLDALRERLTAYAERTRDQMKQPGELAFDVPEGLVVLAGPRRKLARS
jgi:hypothetical protein